VDNNTLNKTTTAIMMEDDARRERKQNDMSVGKWDPKRRHWFPGSI